MATGAVVIARVGQIVAARLGGYALTGPAETGRSVVALEANGKSGRPLEEPCIGGAVRLVATFASIDADSGVFKDEWSAFVDVAFKAGFLICERLIHHVRTGGCSPGGG